MCSSFRFQHFQHFIGGGAETNWQEKLTNIANVVSQASYVTYKLIVNGQEITKMGQEEHAFSVTKVDETGETTVSLYPFIRVDFRIIYGL